MKALAGLRGCAVVPVPYTYKHSSNTHSRQSSGTRCLIFSLNHSLVLNFAKVKALAGLRGCAFAPAPYTFTYAISLINMTLRSIVVRCLSPFSMTCSSSMVLIYELRIK